MKVYKQALAESTVCADVPWQPDIWQPLSSALCFHSLQQKHCGWTETLLAVWRLLCLVCPHLHAAQNDNKHKGAIYTC